MNLYFSLFSLGFVRFGIVGVAATLIHVAIFSMLVELFRIAPVLASVPAFLIAMLVSYRVNHSWTYGARGSHGVYLPRYAVISTLGLGLNMVIIYLIVNILGYWYGTALALVVTVVPAATYLLNRHWSFEKASSSTKL
jgi:putative flippase GtrA